MNLLCWLFKHRWFWTIAVEHDAQEWVTMGLDDAFYRGVWHERICTRCGKEEAVLQKKLYSWYPGDPYYDRNQGFKPSERYALSPE